MENFCTVSYAAHNWVYSFQAYFYLIGNLEYSDTRIHPYRNSMQPKEKKKQSVTITNALCRSNKEPLAPWYFQFMAVWVENVKLST